MTWRPEHVPVQVLPVCRLHCLLLQATVQLASNICGSNTEHYHSLTQIPLDTDIKCRKDAQSYRIVAWHAVAPASQHNDWEHSSKDEHDHQRVEDTVNNIVCRHPHVTSQSLFQFKVLRINSLRGIQQNDYYFTTQVPLLQIHVNMYNRVHGQVTKRLPS